LIYSVIMYDSDGKAVAVMDNAGAPTYSRSRNSADQLSFSVPKGDPKIPLVELGQRFEILRNLGGGQNSLESSGFVSSFGWDADSFIVDGFTEEIILERYFFPAQYGYVLQSENQTLDTFIQQFKKSFIIQQVKGDWTQYIVAQSNIDITTNPEFMILQKSGGAYPSSGFVRFRFDKLASEEWERFRWVSDYYTDEDGEVTTKVSYRQADSIGDLGSVAFTTPQAGALPDVVGIIVASPNLRYLEVQVDFATDTTEASPILFALEVIKRGLTPITTIDVVGDAHLVDTPGLSIDQSSFLSVLIDAFETTSWDFEFVDGTLTIASTLGSDKSLEAVVMVE
jgi:hypothetical protein